MTQQDFIQCLTSTYLNPKYENRGLKVCTENDSVQRNMHHEQRFAGVSGILAMWDHHMNSDGWMDGLASSLPSALRK